MKINDAIKIIDKVREDLESRYEDTDMIGLTCANIIYELRKLEKEN